MILSMIFGMTSFARSLSLSLSLCMPLYSTLRVSSRRCYVPVFFVIILGINVHSDDGNLMNHFVKTKTLSQDTYRHLIIKVVYEDVCVHVSL